MTHFTESTIEQAAVDWIQELAYNYAFGPQIAFDGVGRKLRSLRGELCLPTVMRCEVSVRL